MLVAVLLVAVCGGIGALVAVPSIRRHPWLPLAAVVVLAGLLFVPVQCATGLAASPFTDVSALSRPTSCETLLGNELPELGPFAGDTVGWGLALAGFCLALWVSVVVAGRRGPGDPDDPASR
jgi:hypothetical protein